MATVLAMTACSGGMDDAADDDGACPVTLDRAHGCKLACADETQLCPGATWDPCFEECVVGVHDVAWCP